jgi:hypothetical protein
VSPTTAIIDSQSAIETLQEAGVLGKREEEAGFLLLSETSEGQRGDHAPGRRLPFAGHPLAQELVGNGAPPGLFRQPLARGSPQSK